jgi:hypothetical protein
MPQDIQLDGLQLPRDHPAIVEAEKLFLGFDSNTLPYDAPHPEISKFASEAGWCPPDSQFTFLEMRTVSEKLTPPDMGIHDDCGGRRPAPKNITVLFYLEVPEFGGGLEVYHEKAALASGKKQLTSQNSAVTLSTRPLDPNQVQVLCITHGTWHRPQPHVGIRRVLAGVTTE